MADTERIAYDEFSMFHENAEEFTVPWAGPPRVRRESVGVRDGRQDRAGYIEDLQHLVAPLAGPQIQAERARGVRRVGRVDAAARQLPDEP